MIQRGLRVLLLLALTMGIVCGRVMSSSAAPPPGPIAQDLVSLVHGADLIIMGKVVGVQAGRTAGQGHGRLEFNDVRVSVKKQLKGEATEKIVVEQLAEAGAFVTSEVGPPYQPGERYILFLGPGEGGRHIPVTQGRFLLRAGRVYPTQPGPAADSVKEMDQAKFIAEIEAIVGGNR